LTLAIGWVRKVSSCEELIIASDSRLCGGHRWDECPKILELPRKDCAMCFAGGTDYAYPIMLQIHYASGEHRVLLERAVDINDYKTYILKYMNQLQKSIYDTAIKDDIAENEFIFGGYSWIQKEFKLWKYKYSKGEQGFLKQRASITFHGKTFGKMVIIGDKKDCFVKELYNIISNKYGKHFESYNNQGYNMEPLEALIKLLKNTTSEDTIGGAPQIIKIYQHISSRPIGVYWPNKCEDIYKNRTLFGRRMFEFENTNYWFLDPETMRSYQTLEIGRRESRYEEDE